MGVNGVVHMGQIQSGIRSATRIAQGGHVSDRLRCSVWCSSFDLHSHQIKIKIHTEMPVQVDGEPWIQSPGEVSIIKSALKVYLGCCLALLFETKANNVPDI